ncbi:MADS-box protein [Vigna angularis]|uniref:MADS-box protein n=1 Tax=Phaseolus angularis TaxID=3914 RepID=A0A8T0KWJ1_PHAAN|nr:MADS-box protein [Vigna angularis]
MNTTDLEQLENQLEVALKNIRSTKTQFMLDQLDDLHHRETFLVETNNVLRSKIGGDDANVGASSLSMHGFASGWML